jgi:hypothetical protein
MQIEEKFYDFVLFSFSSEPLHTATSLFKVRAVFTLKPSSICHKIIILFDYMQQKFKNIYLSSVKKKKRC